ncbi:MAG: ferrous iron transport protein A [Puniceicoccales bacterium]|jgi:Fe2+ transport system protein FeoA|nr:ferrous iron transport protein A [Puniceicoccales bacterium]
MHLGKVNFHMVRLDQVEENKCCWVCHIDGDDVSVGKLLPMGISVGNPIEIIYNRRFIPMLICVGDSIVAIDRRKAQKIFVEEGGSDR